MVKIQMMIKNILVPVDFSECAIGALETAILFANQYNAEIHLIHVQDAIKPIGWRHNRTSEEEFKIELSKEREIAYKELNDLSKQFNGPKYKLSVHSGSVVDAVQAYAANNSIDLIIIGSHGASGKQEYFIGSNAQKIIRRVPSNILVVKESMQDLNLKNVVYASNFDQRELETLKLFRDLILPFNPTVHLVHINTDPFFGLPFSIIKEVMDSQKDLFSTMKVKTHYFKDYSVDSGVRHISEELQADLIAISNHLKRPIKRIFSGSSVEALANHSDLPVLSLDYE